MIFWTCYILVCALALGFPVAAALHVRWLLHRPLTGFWKLFDDRGRSVTLGSDPPPVGYAFKLSGGPRETETFTVARVEPERWFANWETFYP